MACCTNIYFAGTVGICEGEFLEVGFSAIIEGEHTLKLSFLETEINIKATFEQAGPVRFPTTGLNESFEYIGQIIDPEGKIITFTANGLVYDCIKFKTTIKTNL